MKLTASIEQENNSRTTSEIFRFSGTITSTTSDSRSAIVELDEPLAGVRHAVISPSTRGRIRAMNGVGGLERSLKIVGTATTGIDALNVVEIVKINR